MHTGFIPANKEIPEDRRLTYLCYEIMDAIRLSDHTACYKKMESPDKNRIFLTRDHTGVTVEAHGDLAETAKEEYDQRKYQAESGGRLSMDISQILRAYGFVKTNQSNYGYGGLRGAVGSVEIWEKN